MPEYVKHALAHFGHPISIKPQHQPHPHTIPTYGAKVQYAKLEDTLRHLTPAEKKFIQKVMGVFLYYYSWAVNSTMLIALSAIASAQAEPTEDTMTRCWQLLDYTATHQNAIITYKKSDLVLVVHRGVSYLSKPKVRSHVGGHFFMSANTANPKDNSAVLNLSQLIRIIMSSAAKLNLVLSASMHAKPSHNKTHLKKWDTSNSPHWCMWECVTAGCKAFSLANGKGTGTNDWVIKSLDD
jgi:hypothetical protein